MFSFLFPLLNFAQTTTEDRPSSTHMTGQSIGEVVQHLGNISLDERIESSLKPALHYASGCVKKMSDPIHFGSEFTFANADTLADGKRLGDEESASPANTTAMERWKEWVKTHCEDCTITKGIDREKNPFYRITHSNGFWFQIALDPWVVETQMKPMTAEEYRHHYELIQYLVFQGAKESAGLTPHDIIGGGHIHLDLETTFKGDLHLFKNFFIDYQNHPELAVGVFGDHSDNAPPLAVQTQKQRDTLLRLVEDRTTSSQAIEDFAKNIEEQVYTETFYYKFGPKKYQAINLNRTANLNIPSSDRTVEIRSFAPQKDLNEFLLILELLEGRLAYVRKFDGLIPYAHTATIKADPVEDIILEPQRVVDQFHDYVTQAGLSWEKFKVLLRPSLRAYDHYDD
jgi:hypothetical protein